MNRTTLRRSAVAAATLCVGVPLIASGTMSAAQAAGLRFTAPISGTATIAKQGQTSPVPAGTVARGELNGTTATSTTTIPTFTTTARVQGLGQVTATVRIVETRPTTTTLVGLGASSVAHFRIEVPRLVSNTLPGLNLVNSGCRTAETSATVTIERFDLLRAMPAKGTFTIPAFTGCGLLRDQLMTSAISGPGNSLDLMVGPSTLG